MKGALGGLVLGIVAVICLVVLLQWTDPAVSAAREARIERAEAQATALAPLWLVVTRSLVVRLGVAGTVLLIGGAWELVLWLRLRRKLVYPQHALYPAVMVEPVWPLLGPGDLIRVRLPVNEERSQVVAALTNGTLDRLPAGGVRAVLNPPKGEEMLPVSDGNRLLSAGEAVAIDLVTHPHALLVGQTGSGKSTATRYLLTQMAERYPCEFVICEPGGVDWNTAAAAWTEAGIAAAIKAVYGEMVRRLDLLREADRSHANELGLRYVVLVVEEMEAVLDDLGDLSREAQRRTRVRLRQIARMGRKAGIPLVAVTQAARTDVFDSHVRTNLAEVWLFRNSQTTAEMFRVKGVQLPGLGQGMAYSLRHQAMVQFPLVRARPLLRLSPLYHQRLTPPDLDDIARGEVIEGEVIDEVGAVVGRTVATAATGEMGSVEAVATVARGELIEGGRRPTAAEAERMRAYFRQVGSKSAVCRRFYGYKDGPVWGFVVDALEGRI